MGQIICKAVITGTNFYSSMPNYPFDICYLVVAGGGGGGGYDRGGGGGAGGFRTGLCTVYCPTTFSVTVGAGGTGGASGGIGTNGSSSVLDTITSAGGGRGGAVSSGIPSGSPGGSGGGSSFGPVANVPCAGGVGNTPATSPSQGNNGGSGITDNTTYGSAGGGGGAGAAGQNASGPATGGYGGNGGVGCASSISGVSTYYAGGGGGGSDASQKGGVGGLGGGGDANRGTSNASGTAGNVNTGGGGGGGGQGVGNLGGAGGSGVVIVSYPGLQRATGGNVYTCLGNTIHCFTSSGNLLFCTYFVEKTLSSPIWVTPSGNIGIVGRGNVLTTCIQATDPRSGITSYTIVSGSLLCGMNLLANGQITGTYPLSVLGNTGNVTNVTFTVRATNLYRCCADRDFTLTGTNEFLTNIFYYTGTCPVFTVPTGVTRLCAKMWGAGGKVSGSGPNGGAGGFASGYWGVNGGDTFTIMVGGSTGSTATNSGGFGCGGQNGCNTGTGVVSGAGGGLSGIFCGTTTQPNAILIAGGGGGGGGEWIRGGGGGGENGQPGGYANFFGNYEAGPGGSQTAAGGGGSGDYGGSPGSGMTGGKGADTPNHPDGRWAGSGGGGGWYGGGGGGGGGARKGAGGGGSGYARNIVCGNVLLCGCSDIYAAVTTPCFSDTDRANNCGASNANGIIILRY